MIHERMNCRLCGEIVKAVIRLTPTPIANLFPDEPYSGELYQLGLKQCQSCNHVQISHVIPDDELYGAGYKYTTPQALKSELHKRASEIRFKYPQAKNVLEIGSNNGLFLHALHDEGFSQVIGIDQSSTDPLVWKMPFNMKSAMLIRNRIGQIDLIVANNVFAHIDDLHEVFDAIGLILSPDGAVVFEVQYGVAMIDSGEFDMIYHEHRDYHAINPLQAFLRRMGMVMTDWEIFNAHGKSLRITAKRTGIEKQAPEESYDWGRFMLKIDSQREWVNSQITGRIPAFGAPAKSITMIYHFGLQEKIEYCVDDTPEKQMRYIAGTNIPVLSREVMAKDNPEQMFLLSWNYEDIIRKSMPNIDFIVPFSSQPNHLGDY